MNNTKVREAVAAGFSLEDVRASAKSKFDRAVAAGIPHDEAVKAMREKYGFDFGYDADAEDDVALLEDAAATDYSTVDEDVAKAHATALKQQEAAAKRQEPAPATPTAPTLPQGRSYSDTELADPSLYTLRDSAVTQGSQRPLTDADRAKQDEMLSGGQLVLGEADKAIAAMPKPVASTSDAMLAGYQHSTTGLFFGKPTVQPTGSETFGQRVAMAIGQSLGDLPTTVAGGVAGAAATSPSGPGAVAGAFAGAMAMNEGVRASLLMAYERGAITTPEEFLYRTGNTALAMGKGAATGYMAGYAGSLAGASASSIGPATGGAAWNVVRAAAQPAVEVATFTLGQAAGESKLPTMEDFVLGGVMVAGTRAGGFYTNKLAYTFQKTGLTPKSIIQYMKESPAAKEDVLSVNMALPQEAGGNLQPLYVVERNTPIPNDSGGGGTKWFHMSRNVAQLFADNINKKNTVSVLDAPEAFSVREHAVPRSMELLWVRSTSDPDMPRIYKQFMREQNPDAKFSDSKATAQEAKTMFEMPTPEFKAFLQSGRAMRGPKENVPIKAAGIRMGDKATIFDDAQVMGSAALETIAKPMEFAVKDILESVSVGEASKRSVKQAARDTYQAMLDRFQPLNQHVDAGNVSVPYMMARNYMGVDGFAQHWLTVGRTAFTRPSLTRNAGFERVTSGKSLQQVLDMGTSKIKVALDTDTSAALEAVSGRIKEASLANNEAQLTQLKALRRDGAITDDMYTKAEAQFVESNLALANKGDQLSAFRAYVVAKHAVEIAQAGMESGVDLAAAKSVASNKAFIERFEPAARELYAYQRSLLEYRYKAGLISKKTLDKIVIQNPNYVPFNRVMEDGTPTSSSGTYGMKGSARDIIDPFESIIRQTFNTLREAERNTVLTLVAKEFGVTNRAAKSKTSIVASFGEMHVLEAAARGAGAERTVSYRVAGKEVKVQVPDEIYRTTQFLDPVSANAHNALVNSAAKVAGVLRAGAILHPNFLAKNPFRDQFSAYINSDSGYKMFYDMGKGFKAIRGHKTNKEVFPDAEGYYAEWLRHGGSNANLVSQDRTYTQDMIRTLLKTNNVRNSVPFTLQAIDGLRNFINPMNWGRGVYKGLQKASELSEEVTRLGEYVRAREQGINPMEAAYRSREVTLDFARMGASMKAFNAMSVFLNAGMQGAERSIRQARAHPLRTANRVIGSIVLPSMLLAMVQQDYLHNSPDSEVSKTLREIPDWQKNTMWIVPSPVGVFRVPMPFEYGVPFANPVRSYIEFMYDKSPDKNFLEKLYDEDYFDAVAEQYFLDWKTSLSAVMPSVMQPVAEVAMNYSLFTGTAVTPPVMESQLPETRYNRNTTELSKSLSRMISRVSPTLESNISQRLASPVGIDYLIAGYGGSLGRDLWRTLDTLAQKAGVVDKVNKPEKSLADLPVIGAITVKYPTAGSKSLNEFFNKADRLEQTMASAQALLKEGTKSSAERATFILMERDYAKFADLRGAITDMSRGIRSIHFAEDIPAEDKRAQIDAIYVDMIELAKGGLSIMKEIERGNKRIREERKQQGEAQNAY